MRLMATAAIMLSTGCVTVDAPDATPREVGSGPCKADAASALIGQTASSETGARALALTGARTLRWGPPRSVWTMDFREDRVNVRYDDAMRITEVSCG
jgi:hypothetical protein